MRLKTQLILLLVLNIALLLWVVTAYAQSAPCPAMIGTASWYSYESCKKEGTSGVYTASQEKFNENDYTAAIWGYPFGSIFKVTNLNNGASVEVRINDRGPSKKLVKKGRIIDLSAGAFRKIASLKQGIIQVKIVRLK